MSLARSASTLIDVPSRRSSHAGLGKQAWAPKPRGPSKCTTTRLAPTAREGVLLSYSFLVNDAIAYFLTWSTYGTRLHGDPRGSVERNKPDRPKERRDPEPLLQQFEAGAGGDVFLLNDAARRAVHESVQGHAEHRGWAIHALNVRTNHVHVVMRRCDEPPEKVIMQCKAWATRRLRKEGLAGASQSIWTRHGSTRWIRDAASLDAAIDYVHRFQ